MENNKKQYLIIDVSEIKKIDFSKIDETSLNTLRLSADKSKTFIKWEDESEPDFLNDLTTKQGPFDHNQILEILSTDFWNNKSGIMN